MPERTDEHLPGDGEPLRYALRRWFDSLRLVAAIGEAGERAAGRMSVHGTAAADALREWAADRGLEVSSHMHEHNGKPMEILTVKVSRSTGIDAILDDHIIYGALGAVPK